MTNQYTVDPIENGRITLRRDGVAVMALWGVGRATADELEGMARAMVNGLNATTERERTTPAIMNSRWETPE